MKTSRFAWDVYEILWSVAGRRTKPESHSATPHLGDRLFKALLKNGNATRRYKTAAEAYALGPMVFPQAPQRSSHPRSHWAGFLTAYPRNL